VWLLTRPERYSRYLAAVAHVTATPCGCGVARSGDRRWSKSRASARAVVNEHRRGWGNPVFAENEERGDGAHGTWLDPVAAGSAQLG
jgi:hypothetical protein